MMNLQSCLVASQKKELEYLLELQAYHLEIEQGYQLALENRSELQLHLLCSQQERYLLGKTFSRDDPSWILGSSLHGVWHDER